MIISDETRGQSVTEKAVLINNTGRITAEEFKNESKK